MFFDKWQQAPNVKKVSELVDSGSHRQKKYISLVFVPSDGKTRSVHIPRGIFIGTILSVFVFSALVLGFYLRGAHLENVTQRLEVSIVETIEDFEEYRETSVQMRDFLRDTSLRAYEELAGTQSRVRTEFAQIEERHQSGLDATLAHINNLERQIREFEAERLGILARLEEKSEMIPPIAEIVELLNASQEVLVYEINGYSDFIETPTVGLLGGAGTYAPATELLARVETLTSELQIQRQLLENIEAYTSLIDEYLRNYPTLMPVTGGVITSGFGNRRDPINGSIAFHDGVDIPAPQGTPIMAAGGGTVTFVGWRNGWGNVVFIDHGFGIVTLYSHNSRNAVEEGQRVERGDIIGYVGSTGRAISPHLHYEVHVNGRAVNPVPFIWE